MSRTYNMVHYRHLLFDLDNTLWNFTENSYSALHDVYDSFFLQKHFPDFDDYYAQYEQHNVMLWGLYGTGKITKEFLRAERFLAPLRRFGILNEPLAKEMETFYLDRCCLKTALMPNALATLNYLKPRYQLHIVSNGFADVQYRKIENCGLSGYFSHIFLSEEIGHHKPSPEFFAGVLAKINAVKEESLVIGDNFGADIEGAMNFGIDQVFYTPQQTEAPLRQPTYIIRDLVELQSFL